MAIQNCLVLVENQEQLVGQQGPKDWSSQDTEPWFGGGSLRADG